MENGELIPGISSRIILLEASRMSMAGLLDTTCRSILEFLYPAAVDLVGEETPVITSPIMSEDEDEE